MKRRAAKEKVQTSSLPLKSRLTSWQQHLKQYASTDGIHAGIE